MFYGHDYGWKNLFWASDFLSTVDEVALSHLGMRELNQSFKAKKEELMSQRGQGFASTGNSLADESVYNLFMHAYLECHNKETNQEGEFERPLASYIDTERKSFYQDSDQFSADLATHCIAQLRASRTALDGTIDPIARQFLQTLAN